jgi:hypothetical protein
VGQGSAVGKKLVCCGAQFSNLLFIEMVDPSLGAICVIFSIPHCGADDFCGEFRVGPQNMVERRVLSGRPDAIRKDFAVYIFKGWI